MPQGKRLEIGDELLVWDAKAKRDEFDKKVKEARKELEDKKFIVFYVDKKYKWHYKKKPRFLYKQTVTKFRPIEMGGAPVYKDHTVSFTLTRSADGKELSRCKTSNPEEIAFLDMKEGIVREEDRELTPYEKQAKELAELKAEKEKMEQELAKSKEEKEEKDAKGKTGNSK